MDDSTLRKYRAFSGVVDIVYNRLSTMKRQTPRRSLPVLKIAPRPGHDAAGERELARLCKALAHPARVRLLKLLLTRDSCVCGELVDELPLAQSTVSQHLKVLKAAGLVTGVVDGPRTCFCVVPGMVRRLGTLLSAL